MKRTSLQVLAVLCLAFLLCSLIWWKSRRAGVNPLAASNAVTAIPEVIKTPEPASVPGELEPRASQAREHAAKVFNRFVQMVGPYDAPVPVDSSDTRALLATYQTNKLGGINILMEVRSGTHSAHFRNGKLDTFYSRSSGLDTREDPSAIADWYACTNTWSEQAMVDETKRRMAALGLPIAKAGKHRFEALLLPVKDPSGKTVRVAPFCTVEIFNKDNNEETRMVEAEYRACGKSFGVTRWYNWPFTPELN